MTYPIDITLILIVIKVARDSRYVACMIMLLELMGESPVTLARPHLHFPL